MPFLRLIQRVNIDLISPCRKFFAKHRRRLLDEIAAGEEALSFSRLSEVSEEPVSCLYPDATGYFGVAPHPGSGELPAEKGFSQISSA